MRGAILHAPGDIRVEHRPDPTITNDTEDHTTTTNANGRFPGKVAFATGAATASDAPQRSLRTAGASFVAADRFLAREGGFFHLMK